MARPLLICDCDGVLLRFAAPFTDYLHTEHALTLKLESFALAGNMVDASGAAVPSTRFPALLDGFFSSHMPFQPAIEGAVAALAHIAAHADVVVLTNIDSHHAERRSGLLAAIGMPYQVIGNRGPKGGPIAALVARFAPTRALFIDDLPPHHSSAATLAPEVHRLHMVAEAELGGLIPAAADAHARIDTWAEALPYIARELGVPA